VWYGGGDGQWTQAFCGYSAASAVVHNNNAHVPPSPRPPGWLPSPAFPYQAYGFILVITIIENDMRIRGCCVLLSLALSLVFCSTWTGLVRLWSCSCSRSHSSFLLLYNGIVGNILLGFGCLCILLPIQSQ
jgi:hypothetical protein